MSSNGTGQLRFTRIALENWRNFKQADIALEQRVFLVGPNASGKSNLLDAFRFLRDIVSIGGGLQSAVARRDGISQIRCLFARGSPDVSIKVEVATESASPTWHYELSLSGSKKERVVVKKELVRLGSEVIHTRPDSEDDDDPDRLTQTSMEQVNVNKKFRPLVDFFQSVKYLHIVPHLVRDPDRSIGRKNDPFGGDFLERVAGTTQKTRGARLRKIAEALSVAVPQLTELKLDRDPKGIPHLKGKFKHWRPLGAWQSERDFSDGTLRLIGLLWAVLDGTGPLLLEEPELSLHPEVVRLLPQLFARVQRRTGRQVILSTHSKDLLQDGGIGLDETVLLMPRSEGTEAQLASNQVQVARLLEKGLSLAEAAMPLTRPEKAEQLGLFDS